MASPTSSSPVHQLPTNFDATMSFYDPEFTADISSKMQVPDRISVYAEDGSESPIIGSARVMNLPPPPPEHHKLVMNVPNRILVAGGDQHIGERGVPIELKLANMTSSLPTEEVNLTAPPRTITLDEHRFPTIDEDDSSNGGSSTTTVATIPKPNLNPLNNGFVVNMPEHFPNELSLKDTSLTPNTLPPSSSEEIALLKYEIAKLTNRVRIIEYENQQRQQKEIIIYSIGVLYFVLKGFLWLHKNW